jgi:DNA polymerase V
MSPLFALVDCNAFFVSCERVFQPRLEGKPVIVLSSNDGCAIARSNEAKALGIRMGDPLFKIKDIVKKHHVHVFSANFSLYGDMSSRVMETLKILGPNLEVYSIDEAFLDLKSLPLENLFAYGCEVKRTVKQWTGIPVSVGMGPTKTLAKIANHLAKKDPSGCRVLTDPAEIEAILRDFPLSDIWGVGRQWSKKLLQYNINTALDLANADHRWVRKAFNIVLARTALELKGTPCLSLEDISPSKKTMISSRSFGTPVTNPEHLREAVSMHASLLAQKLRQQGSKTSLMSVYIRTNPFDRQGSYYSNSRLVSLITPSQDSAVLIKAGISALRKIYKPGLAYKKAGVTVLNLTPETQCTPSLFKEWEEKDSAKRKALLKTMDRLNAQYGRGSLIFASEGIRRSWRPKSGWRSPSYTQDWTKLVEVR